MTPSRSIGQATNTCALCVIRTQICVYNTQMARPPITAAHIAALTGYSRDQLRGLLAELSPFSQRKGEARVANIYSSHDVIVIAICCRLEVHYGLKRAVVAALSEVISPCVAVPRPLIQGARLVLEFDPPAAHYVEHVDDIADGLVVALDPIFATIDPFVAGSFFGSTMVQGDLKFPLLALPRTVSPRRAKAMISSQPKRRSSR